MHLLESYVPFFICVLFLNCFWEYFTVQVHGKFSSYSVIVYHLLLRIGAFFYFLATAKMKLEPVIVAVEGVKGESLTLEWSMTGILDGESIIIALLYFNVLKPEKQAIICNWITTSQAPLVTATGKSIFGNRILVSYVSKRYKVRLNNLQYNDTGPYLLQVATGNSVLYPMIVSASTILTQVKGK